MTLEQAENFYKAFDGQKFHMSREEEALFRLYEGLRIPAETEARWQSELDKEKKIIQEISRIMRSDPGGRGFSSALPLDPAFALWRELPRIRKALLITGFPVRLEDGTAVCETDGPPGIIDIAAALTVLGIPWTAAADEMTERVLRPGLKARGLPEEIFRIPASAPAAAIAAVLDSFAPSHVITLELPGQAIDGHYYNMRGLTIDDMVCDTAALFPLARERSIRIISVGDGGNEAGMGSYRQVIEENVPNGELICAAGCADIALVSGVSNWWGMGICALLGLRYGKDLLVGESDYTAEMGALIGAGAVDGITKESRMSVDGLPLEQHLRILGALRSLVRT